MIHKMQKVIDCVLGEGYEVIVHSENGFGINGLDGTNMSNISIKDLKSHWREAITRSINLIIQLRIQKALNEI